MILRLVIIAVVAVAAIRLSGMIVRGIVAEQRRDPKGWYE